MKPKVFYLFLFSLCFVSSAFAAPFNFTIENIGSENVVFRLKDSALLNETNTTSGVFVPYIGAVANVDLGGFNISAGNICYSDGTNCNISLGSIGNDTFLRLDGANDPMTGDLSMGNNRLTDVGQLIMTGVIVSQDVVPTTDDLYSLGNATHRFKDAYINNLYSQNVYSDNGNITNLSSEQIDSDNVDVNENITMGNITITRDQNKLVFII